MRVAIRRKSFNLLKALLMRQLNDSGLNAAL